MSRVFLLWIIISWCQYVYCCDDHLLERHTRDVDLEHWRSVLKTYHEPYIKYFTFTNLLNCGHVKGKFEHEYNNKGIWKFSICCSGNRDKDLKEMHLRLSKTKAGFARIEFAHYVFIEPRIVSFTENVMAFVSCGQMEYDAAKIEYDRNQGYSLESSELWRMSEDVMTNTKNKSPNFVFLMVKENMHQDGEVMDEIKRVKGIFQSARVDLGDDLNPDSSGGYESKPEGILKGQ